MHKTCCKSRVGTFTWAPRADHLAYITGTGALMAVNADGSNRQELVAQGSGEPYTGVVGIAWSPDGEWLAYERVDVLQKERPYKLYAGLWRIRADGSGATELLKAGAPADYEPIVAGWSPDGSSILFWLNPHFSRSFLADGAPLLALPVDGGAPTQLAETVLAYADFVVPGPPGTDRIAVIVGGNRSVWTNKVLHVLSATTGKDVALTPPGTSASSPAWSPDGQRLAYVAMPDRGDPAYGLDAEPSQMPRRLFVVSARDTLHPQQLTDDPAYRDERPLWSSDGKWLLFVRVDAWGRASLWLIPAGGGTPCRVVEGLTQEPGVLKYYGDWRRTIIPYYGHMDWDTLFDWWRGPAVQQVQPKATAVAPVPTPTTPISANWKTYSSPAFGVTLKYPADWQYRPGYGESYGGEDGLFGLNAVSGEGVPLDEVAQRAAYHKLQPYGSQPKIESLQVQGQPARLILPSADQPEDMKGQAELIVLYPQPVTISGERYRYFVLHADQNHIREIAQTLRFEEPQAWHTYTDTALGFAIDYPADWDADGVRGGFVLLWNPARNREEQQAINIAALGEPSLEAMLDNVERGSFGPYMISAEPVQLGGLEALKVTLQQAPEGLSLLWLVMTPQGGLTIAAYGDPTLAEAIVATLVPITPTTATMDIQVYFAHTALANETTCVRPVTRTIPYTLAMAPRVAIETLLQGPTPEEQAAGFWNAIPGPVPVTAFRERLGYIGDRVRLNSLRIVDGVTYVDFSAEMEAYGGGSARVMCIRQQIVQTLKQFPTVWEVIISVEGRSGDILQL